MNIKLIPGFPESSEHVYVFAIVLKKMETV